MSTLFKMLKRLVSAGLVCLSVQAVAGSFGTYQNHDVSGRSLIFTCSEGNRLRVTPYTDYMIRVQAVKPGEEFFPDDRYEMVADHNLGGTLKLTDSGEFFSLKTGAADGIEVRLYKTGLRPVFYKQADGTVLLEAVQGTSWNSVSNQIKQQFAVHDDEHFTGLGHGDRGRATTLDLAGTAVTREYGPQSMLVVPYYLSSRGYGLFLNSTFHNHFSFGKDGDYSIRIDDFGFGGQMDYFVILGPSFPKIIDRYTLLTGRPRFPQKAIFGLMLSDKGYPVEKNEGASWWYNKVAEHRKAGFPLDCAIFDNVWRAGGGGWQDSWFEFDKARYPDPSAFEKWSNDQGLIVSLDLNRNNVDQCAGWKPEYVIPNTGKDYIDFSRQEVRDWVWNMMWNQAFNPALGYPGDMIWIDEPDELFVKPDMRTGDGRSWAENMNYYFFLNAKAYGQQGWDRHIGEAKRPFIFIRGGTAGGQRYATHWTGDIHATYEEMALQTRGMLLSGLSGFPYFNHDAGGYYDNGPTDPMYCQWSMGMASFAPIWRPHGPGVEKSRWPTDRKMMCQQSAHLYGTLRYKLMPYHYKYAHDAATSGIPMARPMLLEYSDLSEAWKRDLQYFWGNEFLVAPVFSDGNANHEVWFPPTEGNWYDYWTGAKYTGGEKTRTFFYETGKLPLFVKEGAIIPMGLFAQSTAWFDESIRELHVYTGRDGSFELYDDDGLSEKYRTRHQFRTTAITYTDDQFKLNIAAASGTYSGAPSARSYRIYFHGLKNGTDLLVDGHSVPPFGTEEEVQQNETGSFWDATNQTLVVCTGSKPVTAAVEIKPSGSVPESIEAVEGPVGSLSEGSFPKAAAQRNLLMNGSFETGDTSGWNQADPSDAVVSKDSAMTGSFALKLAATDGFVGNTSQTINVQPNTEYKLTFAINYPESGTTGAVSVRVRANGKNHRVTVSKPTIAWEQQELLFNSGEATSIDLELYADTAFSGVVFVDDVSISF